MASEVQTAVGDCPEHGEVEGTREIPRITFPPIINSIRRALAKCRPYRCPKCGAAVQTD